MILYILLSQSETAATLMKWKYNGIESIIFDISKTIEVVQIAGASEFHVKCNNINMVLLKINKVITYDFGSRTASKITCSNRAHRFIDVTKISVSSLLGSSLITFLSGSSYKVLQICFFDSFIFNWLLLQVF